MTFSENRYPPIGSWPEGMLFRIMLQPLTRWDSWYILESASEFSFPSARFSNPASRSAAGGVMSGPPMKAEIAGENRDPQKSNHPRCDSHTMRRADAHSGSRARRTESRDRLRRQRSLLGNLCF